MEQEHIMGGFIGAAICFLVMLVLLCLPRKSDQDLHTLRKEAVELGYAEWSIGSNGTNVWNWKNNKAN